MPPAALMTHPVISGIIPDICLVLAWQGYATHGYATHAVIVSVYLLNRRAFGQGPFQPYHRRAVTGNRAVVCPTRKRTKITDTDRKRPRLMGGSSRE